MKKLYIIFIASMFLLGCQQQQAKIDKDIKIVSIDEGVSEEMREIYIQIEDYFCEAKLYQNETTQELLKQFPKTYTMAEMNGNEKYVYLDETLPNSNERVNQINKGDIMLFGNNCLVIFYKDFKTQYSYTKLGYITDISEFLKRLPEDQMEVTFHKEF